VSTLTGLAGGGVKFGVRSGAVVDEPGGAKAGDNSRGKSSAVIQLCKALGTETSISRLKPTTHSEKRIGRRLRRQWSRTEGASLLWVRLLISTTQLANSTGRRTRVQANKASFGFVGVSTLILRTHRDKSLGARASAQALDACSGETSARRSSAAQTWNSVKAVAGSLGIAMANKPAIANWLVQNWKKGDSVRFLTLGGHPIPLCLLMMVLYEDVTGYATRLQASTVNHWWKMVNCENYLLNSIRKIQPIQFSRLLFL